MNEKIFNAALEFEKIFQQSMAEIQEIVNKTGTFPQEKYIEYALNDRKKMLNILRKFFETETRDDFVTLFGAYCNHYVKKNYHQMLPEKDFGVSELWNVIADENFQKYLLLIQQGIFEQNENCFEEALKLFEEYSLPHLYLFIFAAQKYDATLDKYNKNFNEQENLLEFLYEHYNKMNSGLREYVLCEGKFVRKSSNPALDENFLPYVIKTVNILQDFVFDISKGIATWYPTYKALHDGYQFDRVVNTYRKAYDEYKKILADDLQKSPELARLFDAIFDKIFSAEGNNLLTTEQTNQFLMAQAVIRDKLSFLEKILHDDKDNTFKNELESMIRSVVPSKWRDDNIPAHRPAYLKIPIKITNTGNFLLDQIEKWKLQKDQKKLVADFTHRYKNLRATRLGEIAESLLQMEDEQEKIWGRALLVEQARKETLNKEVTMLTLRYEGDSAELVNILTESLADKDTGVDISEVLQITALNCFVEFFYAEKGDDLPRMRKNIKKLLIDFEEKKLSFEHDVIFDKKNCLIWMKENGFRLQIKIDERWQEVFLQEGDYAEVFLRDIFLEMLKNFLKYGDVTKPVELKLHSDANALKIFMRNFISPKFANDLKKSTNKGLITIDDTLKTLYAGKSLRAPEKCVRCTQSDNIFSAEMEMPTEVFLKGANFK